MEKQKYVSPEMEIIVFETEDVIQTSGSGKEPDTGLNLDTGLNDDVQVMNNGPWG